MKRFTFIISLLLSLTVFQIEAQNTTSDQVIFPIKGKPIKNCQIIEQTNGNLILYRQEQDTLGVLARAYISNGELHNVLFNKGSIRVQYADHRKLEIDPAMSLQENNEYLYHKNLQTKYRKKTKTAIPFMAVGAGLAAIGGAIYYNEITYLSDDGIENDYTFVYAFVFAGTASLTAGTIVLATNLMRAHEHQLQMERIKNRSVSLKMGLQEHGIGFNLKF